MSGPNIDGITDPEILRLANEYDRLRLIELGKELDIPVPTTTTLSLDLQELRTLRDGFVRYSESDQRIYRKLNRAIARLNERLNP